MKWRRTKLTDDRRLTFKRLYHLEDDRGELMWSEDGYCVGLAAYPDGRHTRFIGLWSEEIDLATFERYYGSPDDFHMENLL